MALSLINIGNVAEDGLGDPLRTAGAKINANFIEVYAAGLYIDGIFTRKKAGFTDLTEHEIGDIIEGWTDANKDVYIKAEIESLPFNMVTEAGLFIINKTIRE